MVAPIYFVFGLVLLAMSAVFFSGTPKLLQKKYRNAPQRKSYLRRAGLAHALLGLAGIAYAFLPEEYALHNKGLALALGGIVVAAFVYFGWLNRKFVKRAEAEMAADPGPSGQ